MKGLGQLLPDQPFLFFMYYLYRLSSKVSKHYYIGVTCDRHQREKQHYAAISRAISNSKMRTQPIHRLIAEQVLSCGGKDAKDYYNFEIISTARTSKSISKKEGKALRSSDKWLVNYHKTSTYHHKPNPAVEYLKRQLAERRKIMRPIWSKENEEMYKNTPQICQ